jgi:CheY-like chemotaxis protein
MAHPARQQKEILLVEDNPADVTLLQHAVLEYGKLAWRIYRVADGVAALAFLRRLRSCVVPGCLSGILSHF